MNRYRQNRQGFTLAEMIMAVALLAFFSIFIVQLFAHAEQLTRRANCLDQAVTTATEWADQWKRHSEAELPPEIASLHQNRQPGQQQVVYLDDEYKACDQDQAAYLAVLTIQPVEDAPAGLWILTIKIIPGTSAAREPVYLLTASRYFAGEAGP